MKKDFIKGIAVGCVASVSLLGTIAVYGEAVRKEIYAVYNDIKIVVDGKEITPRDANGNVVDPFLSEGTTYLPVRAVANALGKTVEWDGDTNTVYIGGRFYTTAVGLDKLKDIRGTTAPVAEKITVRGDEILTENTLGLTDRTYVLDGRYKSLTALFAVRDAALGSSITAKVTFKNVDTGEIIAEFTNKVNEKPVSVEINLIGVDKLQIYTSHGAYGAPLYNIDLHPIATN